MRVAYGSAPFVALMKVARESPMMEEAHESYIARVSPINHPLTTLTM